MLIEHVKTYIQLANNNRSTVQAELPETDHMYMDMLHYIVSKNQFTRKSESKYDIPNVLFVYSVQYVIMIIA